MKFKSNTRFWNVSKASVLAISLAAIPNAVYAACSDTGFCGKIFYLGKTADKKNAVFLSAIKTPGKYDVSTTAAFAPGGGGDLPVDTWSKDRKNLRLTVSPYPEDWGGTHILYSYANANTPLNERRFVSSANQTPDGIVFPPGFKPPVIQPPTRPPVTGVMPELPMGVKPPIGTLPPKPPVTGVTPELPMGVKPPIGTLPPKPPVTGVTPELPMGVKPPIGTLPPAPPVVGITPELPMGVKPPIGTLPPAPPVVGITPELPMGVKPPIGTLPPQPPVTGVTPELPTQPTDKNVVVSTNLTPALPAKPIMPCPMQQDQNNANLANQDKVLDCDGMQPRVNVVEGQVAIPLTEGREFDLNTEWNSWADARYSNLKDHRNDLDMSGHSGSVTVGLDRRLDNGLVLGMALGLENSRSSAFDDEMQTKTNGFSVGPYLAYALSEHWVFDGSLSYGQLNNEQQLLMLTGDYTSRRYAASARVSGQYLWNEALIRPKFAVYYAHNRANSYNLNGTIGNFLLSLENEKYSSNYGNFDTTLEITKTYYTDQGTPWMPYAELSVGYEFVRANDGKVMAGDLSRVDVSPWMGAARVGVRSLVNRSSTLEASAGYLSLGQNGLDIWELKLFMSHAF